MEEAAVAPRKARSIEIQNAAAKLEFEALGGAQRHNAHHQRGGLGEPARLQISHQSEHQEVGERFGEELQITIARDTKYSKPERRKPPEHRHAARVGGPVHRG